MTREEYLDRIDRFQNTQEELKLENSGVFGHGIARFQNTQEELKQYNIKYSTIASNQILEYLGGIETFATYCPTPSWLKILEYLGGIET